MAVLFQGLIAPLTSTPASAIPQGPGMAVGWDCCTAGDLDRVGPGWFMDYRQSPGLVAPGHARVEMAWSWNSPDELYRLALAHPGQAWILGNEPNDPDQAQDTQTPASYVAIARSQAQAIRAADPSAAILSAGLSEASTWWAQAIVNAGGGDLFDGWVVHSYNLTGDPYDPSVLIARITRFRGWMDTHGYRNTPLILGEWGVWPHIACNAHPWDADACAADYLTTTGRWLRNYGGVRAWAWFSVRAGGRWAGDLLTGDGQPTTAGRAYRRMFASTLP